MPRKVGRDVYHPLRFNEYSAYNSRIKRHMDNIYNLRNKFIAMNNARGPTIITGKNRTYSVKSLNNPYRDIQDYYINTSQRHRIRDKKMKSINTTY